MAERIAPRRRREQSVPVRARTLEEILNPQPLMARVMHRLLDWIDRADQASAARLERPPFLTEDGGEIFPPSEELWWQTELQKRKPQTKIDVEGDCEAPEVEDGDEEQAIDAPNESGDNSDKSEDPNVDEDGYDYGAFIQHEPCAPQVPRLRPLPPLSHP